MSAIFPANRRPRVLQIAYACRPNQGSEPGMGWNRAVEAAKYCDTTVLCEGTRCEAEVRAWLQTHGEIPGLSFAFVPHSALQLQLKKLPGGFYPAYNLWHRSALTAARELHARFAFDLVHQVTYCGYREPGYAWQLPIPFVWGPIGGTHNYPWRFMGEAGVAGAIEESFRSLVNNLQFFGSRRVRRAIQRSALTMTGNSATRGHFQRYLGLDLPCHLPASGIGEEIAAPREFRRDGDTAIRILWCGNLHPLKGLTMLLKGLAQLPPDVKYRLRVVGRGGYLKAWQSEASRLGIADSIEWTGWVPHAEALRQYDWADVFVHTSLRDTLPGVILEALAAGLPVVCLDHLGMGDTITADCGVKIPVTTPREVSRRFGEAVRQVATDPTEWERLSRGAVERAKTFRWSYQGRKLAELYRDALVRSGRSEFSAINDSAADVEPRNERAVEFVR